MRSMRREARAPFAMRRAIEGTDPAFGLAEGRYATTGGALFERRSRARSRRRRLRSAARLASLPGCGDESFEAMQIRYPCLPAAVGQVYPRKGLLAAETLLDAHIAGVGKLREVRGQVSVRCVHFRFQICERCGAGGRQISHDAESQTAVNRIVDVRVIEAGHARLSVHARFAAHHDGAGRDQHDKRGRRRIEIRPILVAEHPQEPACRKGEQGKSA